MVAEHLHPLRQSRDVPGEQFVAQGIITLRLGIGHAILRHVRQAEPEVVRLHPRIARPLLARTARLHARQQAAGGIAWHSIGIDVPQELMLRGVGRLHAVERLAVDGVAFPPDMVGHPGRRHQVALVRRVDEHGALEDAPADHRDRADRRPLEPDAGRAVEALAAHHGHARLAEHVLVDRLRHVRLEAEQRILAGLHEAIVFALLPRPRGRVLVMAPHAPVEFPRQTADDALVAGVRHAEPAAREPAEMAPWLDDHDAAPHPGRLDAGDHARARPAVNDHVIDVFRCQRIRFRLPLHGTCPPV